jgi:CheY-like chemotaxis protein/glycine cleavage system H lipoate-binding protein
MLLFVAAVITFIVADIIIRVAGGRMHDRKLHREREQALETSMRLDYSREAATLKRVEVDKPIARILCVDDEEVILDSFRKILVLAGYSVDTVQLGSEAPGLIRKHHYDFVFTDLKMPEMSGVEVTQSVKHIRPDIDVIIITGFATVETAVECMKLGATDYVQKPFTEDELLDFTRKALINRHERIQNQLRPLVSITHESAESRTQEGGFSIPGGVFISSGHCWAGIRQDGTVMIGIDDFAKKLIGVIDDIELPNLGMSVSAGQTLFSIRQGYRTVMFHSPCSGRVTAVNSAINGNRSALNITPYGRNWLCVVDADSIDCDIDKMKIGNAAVAFFQSEVERVRAFLEKIEYREEDRSGGLLRVGEMESLRDNDWDEVCRNFFE